jgi:hypothetical protein
LLIDKILSICLNVELKATARGLFFSCRSFWMNYTTKEYKNKSTNKELQLVPMGIATICLKIWLPKITKMLSMRNPNISLMSALEYLCVQSESWNTKDVCECLTTKYEYFLLPFLCKKQVSMMPNSFLFNLSWGIVV